MTLNAKISEHARNFGVDYFGIGDLYLARAAIQSQGGTEIASFTYSISLGITLNTHIVDQLPRMYDRSVALNNKLHAYTFINQRLDLAASQISSHIQKLGYRVLPLPAAERIDDEKMCAAFSHKMGANLAGLGWIGKSCLLVTPDDGPRVRWTTVLTDAPLEPTGKPLDQQCGNCSACVDICPVKAFTGRAFIKGEPREARYDARKCEDNFKTMKNQGLIDVCGLCLYVCPYGRKKNN